MNEQTPTPTPPADAMDIAAGNFDTIENYFRVLEKFNDLGLDQPDGISFDDYYAETLKWANLHPTQFRREMGIVPGEHFEDPTLHLKKSQQSTLVGTVDDSDLDGEIPQDVLDLITDTPQHMDIILDLYNQGLLY